MNSPLPEDRSEAPRFTSRGSDSDATTRTPSPTASPQWEVVLGFLLELSRHDLGRSGLDARIALWRYCFAKSAALAGRGPGAGYALPDEAEEAAIIFDLLH